MSIRLCTVEDVEAVSGVAVPEPERARIERLIEMASAVVDEATIPLPEEIPDLVAAATASMVVRVMANPTQASSESLGQWRIGYFGARGFALSDDELDLLGPWLVPKTGVYAVSTWNRFAADDWGEGLLDFGRDDAEIIPTEGGLVIVP